VLTGEDCETQRDQGDLNPFAVLGGSEEFVRAVAFNPLSTTLASTSAGGMIRLWDLGELGPDRRILTGSSDYVSSLAFQPVPEGERSTANPWLASGSLDGTIRLWRPGDASNLDIRLPDKKAIKAVAFSPPEGRWLAAAGDAGKVYLWDLKEITAETVHTEPLTLPLGDDPPGIIFALAFAPDGSHLAAAARNGTILVWTLAGNDPPGASELRVFGHPVPREDFDKTIRCEPNLRPLRHPQVWSVAFSPDGRTIAAGDSNGGLHLFDLEIPGSQPVFDIHGHVGGIPAVAFSHEGTSLASASCDGTVRLWSSQDAGVDEAHALTLVRELRGHDDAVISIAFSVEDTLLASGSRDQTIRIWDLEQPEDDPGVLGGREEWVRAVAFSPGGKTLAASSADSAIRLWTVDAADLFAQVCTNVGRPLSSDEWIQFLGRDLSYQPACEQSRVR
jgi:WD40 repeat protein